MEPIIIIPAYNPDDKLITLVKDIKELDLPVIVVNDGSKDECLYIFDIIRNMIKCHVCAHEKNMGKGAALKTGIRYAVSNFTDCSGYVTADADGQHSPKDILTVAEILKKNPDSLILGKRNFDEKNVPFKSFWGNKITSFVFFMSTGKRCADTQTGLRGIPRKFTDLCLNITGNKYEYEMNMLLKMGSNNIPFVYVPINTIYIEENASSHFHPVRDSLRIYLNIFKYSLSSLTSAITDLAVFTLLMNLFFKRITTGILAATVIARLISGSVNFSINKHWVFQSKNNYKGEILKYLTLFCSQMMMSWILVSSFKGLPFNITLIKIAVDSVLFIISYQIQKKYIFHSKSEEVKNADEKIFYKTI